jgi:cytochrome c-type biogenesis protein CcmH
MVWILGALACFIFIGLIARSIVTPRDLDSGVASKDLLIYKDQLVEVEKDLEKGVLSKSESDAARIEVSRRILLADKRSKLEKQTVSISQNHNKLITFIILIFILAGSFSIYAFLGNPSLPDMPLQARLAEIKENRSQRISQEEAELLVPDEIIEAPSDYLALVSKLRIAMKERPNDIQGLRLLALHWANIVLLARHI